MSAWTQLTEPGPALLLFILAVTSAVVSGAPFEESEQSSEIEYYPIADATGCYYNFEHYDEGDRIITNEPCLNCTCHNRMLMCYLRVCPFTKAIGQDCKVEKKADQCCPVITCPEVPVHLLSHDTTTPSTALGHLNEYGCSIDNLFYSDGAKVPSNPNNPCEVCYCIRNKTACIIQECTLTGKVVEGCTPVYVDGVCCPVRYDCDHPQLETTPRPLLTTTTTTLPPTSAPTDCIYENEVYADGALMKKDVPCEQCYCMKGDIVCAVQECGPTPLDKVNCTALPPKEGQCCPDTYECENISEEDLTTLTYYEAPTTQPTIVSSKETTTPGLDKSATISQEEQTSAETERQVTEAVTPIIEESGATQPVTESVAPETFTSMVTEAITSRVTDIIEAITSAVSGSDQGVTTQPPAEIETTEPGQPIVTEKSQTIDQQATTESEIEKETESQTAVTEGAGQITQISESEKPKITTIKPRGETEEEETVTEPFEIPAHDDHEEAISHEGEIPHEDETEVTEGSGKPIEEQPITSTPKLEEAATTPVSQTGAEELVTVKSTEAGLLITTERPEENTETGSGEPEEPSVVTEVQPTLPTEAEVTTSSRPELPKIPGEDLQTETAPPAIITGEATTEETTEIIKERQTTTKETLVTDSEAQETVQPLEPDRSTTEKTQPESPVTPEIGTTVTEEVQEHHDITTHSEAEVTEESRTEQPKETVSTTESSTSKTVKPEETVTEAVPPVVEISQTTTRTGEEKVTSITEEPVTEIIQKVTGVPEERKPASGVEESKPVTTTEQEELEFITEIPVKETERPESMDHISETVPIKPTSEAVTEVQVTEKPVAPKETEQPSAVTESITQQPETYPKITEGTGTTPAAPGIPESCGDKECKSSQDENEIPTEVEESCTKESCKPREQVPSSEVVTEKTVQPPREGTEDITVPTPEECSNATECAPDLSEKEKPLAEKCISGQDCVSTVPGKETEGTSEPSQTIEPIASPASTQLPEITTEEGVPGGQATTEQPEEASEKEPISVTEHPGGYKEKPESDETSSTELVTEEKTEQTTISEKEEQETEPTKPTLITVQPEKSTEGELIATEPTTQRVIVNETELTTAPPRVTPLHEVTQTPTETVTSTQTPKEETILPEDTELAVSPIGPDHTEEPKTVVTVSAETQEPTQTPKVTEESTSPEIVYQTTEAPQQIVTENIIGETTQQPDTKESQTDAVSHDDTTPSPERITPETTYVPVTVKSEATPATELVSEGTESPEQTTTLKAAVSGEVTQVTPILDVESSQTTVRGTEPPTVTQVPEVVPTEAPGVTVVSSATESVTETEKDEDVEILGTTPISESGGEQTTAISHEGKGTELPEETVAPITEQPAEESSQIPEQGTKSSQEGIKETPLEGTTEIPRSESTEEIPSERVTTEVSEPPSETEVPISATEAEIEVTSESSEEHGIPGEGSCLVDGQTYKNNSQVPPINQCQTSCKCLSSILQCESIPCTPPPNNLQCTPIFQSPAACCPIYSCSVPGGVTSMESDSHVVEATTVGQEEVSTTVAAQEVPSEEGVTYKADTEEVPIETTVEPESITEGVPETTPTKSVEQTETERSTVSPTEVPTIVETPASTDAEVTTQKEVSTGTESVGIVTEKETKEGQSPKSETTAPGQTTIQESPTTVPSVIPIEEAGPSQDDIENEIPEEPILTPELCGVEGCVPVVPTAGPPSDEITTVLPEVNKPLEHVTDRQPGETDKTVTEVEEFPHTTVPGVAESSPEGPEQPEEYPVVTQKTVDVTTGTAEPQSESITVSDISEVQTTAETVTEVSSESSQTPEEMAAVPEMEEAVTTPSILDMTEKVLSEVSPTASEQTTTSPESEKEITTEIKSEAEGTPQPTVSQEIGTTVPSQTEKSSLPVESESTEKLQEPYQPTVSPETPIDTAITTEAELTTSQAQVTEVDQVTELDVSATSPSLETEAYVTEVPAKKIDQPQAPTTETITEGTWKPKAEATTVSGVPATESPQTESPEEAITQRISPVEQQPTKPTDFAQQPVSTEATTPVVEVTETATVVDVEKETVTEGVHTTPSEIGEFPTHAPVEKVTQVEVTELPVTETKEITTSTSLSPEAQQPPVSSTEVVPAATESTALPETESQTTAERESTYTSPQLTTQAPLNGSELFTSGPKEEPSTRKSVEGELSTSIPLTPVSTSEPSTVAPSYVPPHAPGHHEIPGEHEHVPELPDYPSPVEDYDEEEQNPLGPGTCRYGGKVYVSAQQIPRDDPCDFCFCFRSDIICLQQSCPPPIPRCHEEPIRGFCCPRYECPVGMATAVNVTTSTTTTTTTLPPHFLSHAYRGRVTKSGCQIKGRAYKVGDVIPSASGPCLHCTCGGDGEMKCDPKACSPEPMLRQIAAAASRRRR